MIPAIHLGVNIDHVATVRQARRGCYPDPIHAAYEAVLAGASNITLHLREDRRHIQEQDVEILKKVLTVPMNLELAITPWMLQFAGQIQPQQVCFVPEKREELTTEGGLDVSARFDEVKDAVTCIQSQGMDVSLFIDPDLHQIDHAVQTGARAVELHTGAYAEAAHSHTQDQELNRLLIAAQHAHAQGLVVHAGHGLHYHNVQAVAAIGVIHTLNIGHAIVAQAMFCGMKQAVQQMRALMHEARVSHE
jgi:pyridoxine 5-phosphate synthase